MGTAFRDKLRTWGDRCSNSGETFIVWIPPDAVEGERNSYKEVRRIVVGFASMVQHERIKVRRRFARSGEAMVNMPLRTPYEDVLCRAVQDKRGGWAALFTRTDSSEVDAMYVESEALDCVPPTMLANAPQLALADLSTLAAMPDVELPNADRVSVYHDPHADPADCSLDDMFTTK